MSFNKLLSISGFLLALGVTLGAFGAHLLKDILSLDRMITWQTAVQYQVWNTLGLIAITLVAKVFSVDLKLPSIFILTGISIFSGSLYLLCLTNIGKLGIIPPIGGVLLITGWVLFAIKILKAKSEPN